MAVVPVYDHGATVGRVVRELGALGAPVIAVDDGSSDDSGAAAAAAGAVLVRHEHNQGKGAALRTGFAAARERGFARALTCDADGQHPADACAALAAQPASDRDIVVGVRDMAAAPGPSRFGRTFSNFWVRMCCGVAPGDSQSGLRIYPLEPVLALAIRAPRYHYEMEVLVRLVWAGGGIATVPVRVIYPPDRVSHFRLVRDNLRITAMFTRLMTRRCLPWPHRRLIDGQRPPWYDRFLGHLDPVAAGTAAGVGAAFAVAPAPGAQMLLAGYVAWSLRLNLPLVLLASNLSAGPLLAAWAAVAMAIGHGLRKGEAPWTVFPALHRQLSESGDWTATGRALLAGLGDWALGAVVLMPLLGGLVGLATWFLASRVARARRCQEPPST